MPHPIPLLIDCDTGIDDALALLYACASPEAEIVAVTCTAGNVDGRQVALNSRAVLELAGRPEIEVALGREIPLLRPLRTTPDTHGPQGLGHAVLPPPRSSLSSRHGADLIIEEVRRRPGEITLVTLGPLTNLALAVLREPALPDLVDRLVMMAGTYRTAGNTSPTSEWNVAVDPEAMKIVLDAFGPDRIDIRGTPMAKTEIADPAATHDPAGQATDEAAAQTTSEAANDGADPAAQPRRRPLALGLDITEHATVLPHHLELLAARAGCHPDGRLLDDPTRHDPLVRFVIEALRYYMEFHQRFDGFYGAFVHDPFALAAALDPALVTARAVAVDVELGGVLTTGQTVTDWRNSWHRAPNLDVVVEAQTDTFLDRLTDRLGGHAQNLRNMAS